MTTDPEKLRALIAEMRRANECINAAVTATDYQVACVALALIARQFLRDSEALSTLLAEAERPTVEPDMVEQFCRDLNAAHDEILRLQGVLSEDYGKYDWPEWSGPANSIRWAERLTGKRLSKTSLRGPLRTAGERLAYEQGHKDAHSAPEDAVTRATLDYGLHARQCSMFLNGRCECGWLRAHLKSSPE
jgi:hypothetical protein